MIGETLKTLGTAGLSRQLILRFCLIGLPVYLVICLALIFVYREHRKESLEEEIAAETSAVTAALARATIPFLRDGNKAGIAAVLRVASGSRALRCVAVTPLEDVAIHWPGYPCREQIGLTTLTVPIRDDHVILGHLLSQYSTEWAERKLLQEAIFLYWATALGTLAAFVALAIAYRAVVGRRIGHLCAVIRHRQQTGEDRSAEIVGTDPLAEVAIAYNGMMEASRLQRAAMEAARAKQAALAEAAASARAETEARTRFLEAASHDLRTPLNGILGAAEILNGANLTAKQRRCSFLLRDASEQLEETIAAILREGGQTPSAREEGGHQDGNNRTTNPVPEIHANFE